METKNRQKALKTVNLVRWENTVSAMEILHLMEFAKLVYLNIHIDYLYIKNELILLKFNFLFKAYLKKVVCKSSFDTITLKS